jgi:hypothetical protein
LVSNAKVNLNMIYTFHGVVHIRINNSSMTASKELTHVIIISEVAQWWSVALCEHQTSQCSALSVAVMYMIV